MRAHIGSLRRAVAAPRISSSASHHGSEEPQRVSQVALPIIPGVRSGKLVIRVRDPRREQRLMQRAIAVEQCVFRSTIETQRRQPVAIAQERFPNAAILARRTKALERLL